MAALYLHMFAPAILSPCGSSPKAPCMEYPREGRVYRPDRNKRSAARSEPKKGLRRRFHFHFRIKVGNDVLEGGDRLLNRGDLHQFPAIDRAITILQGDNQIPPLFLKLDKRQTVVRQRSHHDV